MYPNCNEKPLAEDLCKPHEESFYSDRQEIINIFDWLKYEFERLNGAPVAPKKPNARKCIYPNCQASARECVPYFFPDGDDASQGQELFCKWHRDNWGSNYIHNPFEWCKSEYERINSRCAQATKKCEFPSCDHDQIIGENLCFDHALLLNYKTEPAPKKPKARKCLFCDNIMPFNSVGPCDECYGKTHKERGNEDRGPGDSILLEADSIVNGARATDYGDAVDSFKKIATVASILAGRELFPLECCLVLKAVKLVRESYKHKRDNLVDECGYAELENRIRTWMVDSGDENVDFNKTLERLL
jgi:hypothetical protein